MEPRPFAIQVPDEVLADLRERLGRVRWPDEVPGADWAYGTDLAYLKQLVAYWRDGYDWRANEARLNAFTQYTVPIADIDLHFIHEPGVGPDPLPLLISHGWPGSVVEFHKLIPMLTDPARFGGDPADAFTVVAPSLPGLRLLVQAEPAALRHPEDRRGVRRADDRCPRLPAASARTAATGARSSRRCSATTSPERLPGIHLTMLPIRRDQPPDRPTEEEARYLEELAAFQREETGYQLIQGTKPQTLAYGLTDSPVGPGGLDRREVPHLERLRRRRRAGASAATSC